MDNEVDWGHLTASRYMKTGMLVDNCGNPRVVFLPDPCVPLTGEEECEDNPLMTELKGNVHVECHLSAGSMQVDELSGNGCKINNTDDTKIIGFEHIERENEEGEMEGMLVLKQQNSKVCEGEEFEEEVFEISTAPFTQNTVIEDFSFDIDEETGEETDLLTILDSDGNTFTADLSKYNNNTDRYVAPGEYEATPEGIIELPYSVETEDKVIIDISQAVHGFRDMDFDRCRGVLTVRTSLGDLVEIEGFPTNISMEGRVDTTGMSGTIYWKIENKTIMVNCNFNAVVPVGNIASIGFLPIRLKREVAVWLTSMHGTSYTNLSRVQITVTTNGEMQLRQSQVPERIQDSFVILFDSIKEEYLDEYCNQ